MRAWLTVKGTSNRVISPQTLIEWGVILVGAWVYLQPLVAFGTDRRLPGSESEFFQFFDHLLVSSLKNGLGFPLWNPHFFTGLPYIGDSMSHAFNPFITLPVLILGVLDGFKLAILIHFILGGLGTWWLARQIGLAPGWRIWAALMFMFSGVFSIKFLQGHYLMIFGLGWVPISLAALLKAINSRKPVTATLAAAALALLFFSGNGYFAYYMLWVVLIAAIAFLPVVETKPFHVSIPGARAWQFLLTGLLALGLVSVQLLPMAEMIQRSGKKTISLEQSHTIGQIWQDFTSRDAFRQDTESTQSTLRPEEYYAYIGIIPFVGAALALATFRMHRKSRWTAFLGGLIVFTILWVDLQHMPWRDLLTNAPILNGFRYQTRMLAIGTIAILLFAAIGFDTAWRLLQNRLGAGAPAWVKAGAVICMLILIGLPALSVTDAFTINRKVAKTFPPNPTPETVFAQLKELDSDLYYVSAPNNWYVASSLYHVRQMDLWYPIGNVRSNRGQINIRPVTVVPNYIIRHKDIPQPEQTILVTEIEDHLIYKNTAALPFAFTVPLETLLPLENGETPPLLPAEVNAATVGTYDNNHYQVILNVSDPNQILVISGTHFPGWNVTIDGEPAALVNVGGLMATNTLMGEHTYTFSYQPASFYFGLAISLASLFAIIVILSKGLFTHPGLAAVKTKLRNGINRLMNSLPKPGENLAAQSAEQPTPDSGKGNRKQNPSEQEDNEPVSHADIHLEIPAGMTLQLTISAGKDGKVTISNKTLTPTQSGAVSSQPATNIRNPITWPMISLPSFSIQPWLARARAWISSRLDWHTVGFAAALIIYLLMVVTGLETYPAYFFTDEAVHANMAADFIANGYKNYEGEFLPTYFSLGSMFSINSVSVYLQVIPYLLFGKSVFITRLVSALVTLMGAFFIGLTLKQVFNIKHHWLGVLLLVSNAAWFLHARTAFEYVELASFFAGFLYFYLRYRTGQKQALYGAVLFGTLAFYTHGLGQVLMGSTALALLILDFRYHLKPEHRPQLIWAALLALLLFLPFLRYYFSHQEVLSAQLQQRNSYWSDPSLTLPDQFIRFGQEYIKGLNPGLWFFQVNQGLVRHIMRDYPHLWMPLLPALVLGSIQIFRNLRDGRYTTLLVALLVSPIPSALVEASVLRMLWLIIPVTILASIGTAVFIEWAGRKFTARQAPIGLLIFILIAGYNLHMLHNALTNGPRWFNNYTLYGLQFGAREVFQETILPVLQKDPAVQFRVSPNWANGTDELSKFFIPPQYQARVILESVDNFAKARQPISRQVYFVITPDEYTRIKDDPVFQEIEVLDIVPYPDASPGFYMVTLSYSEQADQIFEQEALERAKPMEGSVEIAGEVFEIIYSRIETGQIADIFDGNPSTLVRGVQANPFILDITFPETKTMSGFSLTIATIPNFTISAIAYSEDGTELERYTEDFTSTGNDPTIDVQFTRGVTPVYRLVIEILDNRNMETTKTHVRELRFLP